VDELLEMIKYEFTNAIYPKLARIGDTYLTLPTEFDQHFQVIFRKWESKTKELATSKTMKSFDQTKKGKKVMEKKGDPEPLTRSSTKQPSTTEGGDSGEGGGSPEKDSVALAREKLKERMSRKPTKVAKQETPGKNDDLMEQGTKGKEDRNWGFTTKLTQKDMDKIDMSANKEEGIDLEFHKNRYLGGDDDVFEGFYGSDEEIDFENFKKKSGP